MRMSQIIEICDIENDSQLDEVKSRNGVAKCHTWENDSEFSYLAHRHVQVCATRPANSSAMCSRLSHSRTHAIFRASQAAASEAAMEIKRCSMHSSHWQRQG